MPTALETSMLNDTYHDVERLIYWTVHRFIKRKGGDFEQCLSTANATFVNAYHRYDPATDGSRSRFTYYVQWIIYKDLLEEQRNEARKARCAKIDHEAQLETIPTQANGFHLGEFLEELGEDARLVATLVLDTPRDLARAIRHKGGHGMNYRSVLRSHLQSIGWTTARVTEAFHEISNLLRS